MTEYKMLTISGDVVPLNEAAKDGWEVIGFATYGTGLQNVLLKRTQAAASRGISPASISHR